MHQQGDVLDRVAAAQRERPFPVRRAIRRLGIDPHHAELAKQPRRDGVEARAALGGYRQRGKVGADQLVEDPLLLVRDGGHVGLVHHQERRQANRKRVAERGVAVLSLQRGSLCAFEQGHVLVLQQGADRLHLLDAGRLPQVDDQQAGLRRLQRVADPRHGVVGGQRRQVDQLKVNVLVREHAGLRVLCREGIGPDARMGAGEAMVQRRLAHVGRADDGHLGGAFRADDQRWAAARGALARAAELLGELLDAGLDVRLQVLGALVLGNRAQHLPQAAQALRGVTGSAESRLGTLVLGTQVGRHGVFDAKVN